MRIDYVKKATKRRLNARQSITFAVLVLAHIIVTAEVSAQEFPIMADHANKYVPETTEYEWFGKIVTTTDAQALHALNYNWLHVYVNYNPNNPGSTDQVTEASLGYNYFSYMVDRGHNQTSNYPYNKCNNTTNTNYTSYPGMYVRGSACFRFNPESSVDLQNPSRDFEHMMIDGGVTSVYTQNFLNSTYNCVGATQNETAASIITLNPNGNINSQDEWYTVSPDKLNYIRMRLKIGGSPNQDDIIVNIRIKSLINNSWVESGSATITGADLFGYSGWAEIEKYYTTDRVSPGCQKIVEIEWQNKCTVYIDWLEIYSECTKDVVYEVDVTIGLAKNFKNAVSQWYNSTSNNNIRKIKVCDEVNYSEYTNLRRINTLIHDTILSGTCAGFAYYWDWYDYPHRYGFYRMANQKEMSTSMYPYSAILHLDDGTSYIFTSDIQASLRSHAEQARLIAELLKTGPEEKVFWPVVQTFKENNGARFPRAEEYKANVGLALCYSAQGLVNHCLEGNINTGYIGLRTVLSSPSPIPYRDETRDTVAVVNGRLKNIIGPKLLSMTWDNGYDGPYDGQAALQNNIIMQNNGNAFCNSVSSHPVQAGSNADASAFVEIGDYSNTGGLDALLILNKRTTYSTQDPTAGDRVLVLGFNNSSSLLFRDYESHEMDVIPQNGLLRVRLLAGDFCLREVSEAVVSEDMTVDNVLTVHTDASLEINSIVTLAANAKIVVDSAAHISIGVGGKILLNGGEISCSGSGHIDIIDPDAIQGSGVMKNVSIKYATEMTIPEGSTIVYDGNCNISYDCNIVGPKYLVIMGEMIFSGSNSVITFGDCLQEIRVANQGKYTIVGNIIVDNTPTINVWDGSEFRLLGLDVTHKAILRMKSRAEINCSSSIIALNATIEGRIVGTISDDWDGVQVIGAASLIDFEKTDIRDIYGDLQTQGSGLHLYAASNTNNRLLECNIDRWSIAGKFGDGVFLQPEGLIGSALKIECVSTEADWWTGVTTVASDLVCTGLRTKYNIRGFGSHIGASTVFINESEISSNSLQGVFIENSIVAFGKYPGDLSGRNLIEMNGSTQIELHGAQVLAGDAGYNYKYNDIGHTSLGVPRIILDASSVAEVRNNYWLTANPTSALFINSGGVCNWIPYEVQPVANSNDWTCPPSYSKRSLRLMLPAVSEAVFDEYARAGRMGDLYQYITGSIWSLGNAPRKIKMLSWLGKAEVSHVREYPDSALTSCSRYINFVNMHAGSISQYYASDILAIKAEYYTLTGLCDSAAVIYAMLENYYGATQAFYASLGERLLNAMSMKDSIEVDNVVGLMIASNLDSSSIRLARNQRRAFLRCLKVQQTFKKNVIVGGKTQNVISTVEVYPTLASDFVSVQANNCEGGDMMIEIVNINGNVVFSKYVGYAFNGQTSITVDISKYKSGIYFCRVFTAAGPALRRILVVR
jgi:hypothetical protein